MRYLIVLGLLLVTFMMVGCAAQKSADVGTVKDIVVESDAEISDDEAMQEIDSVLVDENDDVEIGEMV